MNYAWGFSWEGLVIFGLVLLPNLLYFRMAKRDPEEGRGRMYKALALIEHGSQAVFVALLLFLTGQGSDASPVPYVTVMVVSLLAYYALWIFHFAGRRSAAVLLGMATLPVAYFIAAELWLRIPIAVIPTVLFGMAHTGVTLLDLGTIAPRYPRGK